MEKVSLPKDTKFAAQWFIVFGLLQMFYGFIQVCEYADADMRWGLIILWGLISVIIGTFLLKKKRWAWWLAMFKFSLILVLAVIHVILKSFPEFSMWSFIQIIPFILLLLDRKNFWKIAT